jgi:hypothetical protein
MRPGHTCVNTTPQASGAQRLLDAHAPAAGKFCTSVAAAVAAVAAAATSLSDDAGLKAFTCYNLSRCHCHCHCDACCLLWMRPGHMSVRAVHLAAALTAERMLLAWQ